MIERDRANFWGFFSIVAFCSTHHHGHALLFPCLLALGSIHFNHGVITEGQLGEKLKKKKLYKTTNLTVSKEITLALLWHFKGKEKKSVFI